MHFADKCGKNGSRKKITNVDSVEKNILQNYVAQAILYTFLLQY